MKLACHRDVWCLLSTLDIVQKRGEIHVYSDFCPKQLLRYDVIIDPDCQHLQAFLLNKNYRGATLVWFSKNANDSTPKLSKQIVLCTDVDELTNAIASKQSDIVV